MTQKTESAKALASGAMRMSKRIFLSYVLDWVLIIGIAAIGGGFNKLKHTNKRPFSLQDPSLTYPIKDDTVSVAVVLIVSLVAPGVITAIVSLLFIPGPTASKSTSRALIWRRKIWEWNTAWMGLGLSLASAFVITEGLKDLGGKPRPYFIAKCRPNLNNIDQYRVGGLGQSLDTTYDVPIRVSAGICQEKDPAVLREIFASWPSGHSSFSFAGLLYLSLFLCAKFAVGIPYTMPDQQASRRNTYDYDNYLRHPQGPSNPPRTDSADFSSSTAPNGEGAKQFPAPPPRNSAAAPPIYLLLLAVFLPVGTAIFICVSRWFDFHHHGIDILSGALLGAFCAYFSFRYYHMPIRRGSGWSWGARSRDRAFWVGVGRDGYVGDEGWTAAKAAKQNKLGDVESAHKDVVGPGIADDGDVEDASGAGSQNVRQDERYTIQNQT